MPVHQSLRFREGFVESTLEMKDRETRKCGLPSAIGGFRVRKLANADPAMKSTDAGIGAIESQRANARSSIRRSFESAANSTQDPLPNASRQTTSTLLGICATVPLPQLQIRDLRSKLKRKSPKTRK
jgi:hypothetical protein